MTWQLGAFGLLAIALAAGFVWYERSRPDARIVALVGTLAALAALGRIAFAALPNVKPTTDIVLISGYALGGAPGFVVGAVAGLVSNFFFGQGPWTPWQMAGWGLVGVLGAGLASLTRRRLRRWPLAVACAVVGFAFTAVQDIGDWVTYSDHSAAQLGVYVGKGVGFDLVHAAGCLAFALLFGPALTRSVQRFATRLQMRWRAPGEQGVGAAGAMLMVALVGALGAGAGIMCAGGAGVVGQARAAAGPESYLLAAQNGDGGFGAAPGQPSSQMYAAWAALGLAAEGVNPAGVRHGGPSVLAYVSAGAGASADTGALERTILVERAAGAPARGLLGVLQGRFRGDGSVSGQVNLTSFGVLALRAAGAPMPAAAIGWLLRQQNRDGGFSFATAGTPSDVDDTAAALEALAAGGGAGGGGGVSSGALRRAVAYIRAQQNSDGGFPQQAGEDSNAQSTAWAVQGLLAAGVAPGSLHRTGAASPVRYLDALVAPDGHVRYSAALDQTPVWVTGEAAMALAGKPLPLAPVGGASSAGVASGPRPRTSTGGHARARDGRTGTGRRSAASAGAHGGGHASRAGRRPARRAASPPALVERLAADAGFATALALAPVGLG